MSGPPKSWTELCDLLGEAGAQKMVDGFGGEEFCVPRKYEPNHLVARQLGSEAFSVLVRFWGGCRIYVPTMAAARRAVRDEGIRRKRAQGETLREIARSGGLSERQVRNILARGIPWHRPRPGRSAA